MKKWFGVFGKVMLALKDKIFMIRYLDIICLLFAKGSENTSLRTDEIKEALFSSFDKLGLRKKVLAIPPDISRFHSMSGEITGTRLQLLPG